MLKIKDKIRVCNRCLFKVYPSCIDEYDYQCYEHDEDLFLCETFQMTEEDYYLRLSDIFNCSVEEIREICEEYDSYISNCYLHDEPVEVPLSIEEYYEKYGHKQNMQMEFK